MALPPVIVTNFKRRLTGVTTTALNVTAYQRAHNELEIGVCGPLHEWKLWQVLVWGWARPPGRQVRVWHVRRNAEMAWGLLAKRILRQPVRLVFTSAAIRRHSAYPRWLIAQMDAVVATSDAAAALVPNVTTVQAHGVDTASFRPAPKTSAPSLVVVGRIRPEKGIHVLIEALCHVLPDHQRVRVHMIGQAQGVDRAFEAELRQKLQAAGIDQQVFWHGEQPQERVAELMSQSHILVATPLYEGYGLTALEGLASGCAVLLSDTGIFAEVVAHDSVGRLVPVNDAAATAAALADLLSDANKLKSLQQRAREVAEVHYSIEAEAHRLLNLYNEIANAAS